ncbi:hypothetical protein GTQ34_03520 [Muricauda sp. JGD-17]|uniref:Uncharacterized protein n=1 Tax=Flagellimonas ochracea TaxID=2696472 RepID=A0A964TA12_9FLAO|nr:hypothetical protein [Allomuricauda ochracea]NAY90979.1 hypothetical protein [Allomuricauda ochracea]
MRTRDLLRYLEKLEIGLSNFSYEELGTVEAGELKKSFEIFRNGLEEKVFGMDEINQLEQMYDEMGIKSSPKENVSNLTAEIVAEVNDTEHIFLLIASLEKTELNPNQKKIAKRIKSLTKKMVEDTKLVHKHNKPNTSVTPITIESYFNPDKIDLTPVLEECMGQMELLEELIKCYRHNVLEFIGSIKVQLDGEYFSEIRVSCQKILPSLKMMKTTGLMQLVSQMDMTCKTDRDLDYLKFLYNQFLVDFPKADKMIDHELNALRNM